MGIDCQQPAHPLPADPTPFSTTLPSVADLLSSRPSPIDTAYHRPSRSPPSPTTISSLALPAKPSQHSTNRSKPHPLASHPDQSPTNLQPAAQPRNLEHAQALSSSGPLSTDAPRLQKHPLGLGTAVHIDSNFKNITSTTPPDPGNNSTTRQHRFNVRFLTSYTSENMPLQKPRNDLASTTPASTETSELQATLIETPVAPSVELSISPATPNPPPAEALAQGRPRRRDPSVERCPGCNEAWKRPLPNTDLYRHNSPAENSSDYSKITMNMVAQLVDHGKKADAMYDRWKWKHSHCVPAADDEVGLLTPPVTESQDDSYATGSEGPSFDSKRFHVSSNKRKVELLQDDVLEQPNSKVQKTTLDPEPSIAVPASPSDLS